MAQAWTDKGLSRAARQAMAKIQHVLPQNLKPVLERQEIIVPDFPNESQVPDQLAAIRGAIKHRYKVCFSYQRADGLDTRRIVHPLGPFYWGKVWPLAGWCELRDDFRHFRLDRMSGIALLEESYGFSRAGHCRIFLQPFATINGLGRVFQNKRAILLQPASKLK